VLTIPAAALVLALVGCGSSASSGYSEWARASLAAFPTGPVVEQPRPQPDGPKPLFGSGRATLRGQVRLLGSRPNLEFLNNEIQKLVLAHPRREILLGSPQELGQQRWRIGEGDGVGNVVVWLKAPEGSYLTVKAQDKVRPRVTLKVQTAVFEPHTLILFPHYRSPENPARLVKTGQSLVVQNTSSRLDHTVRWGDGGKNPRSLRMVFAGTSFALENLVASPDPVRFSERDYGWMSADVWVFDHPYAAVTDANGMYQIPDVPVGVKLRVVAWHETGYLDGGKEGTEIELREGDNRRDFVIRAK
jgi:hypothetical protein